MKRSQTSQTVCTGIDMAVTPSTYYVRIKVEEGSGGVETFHTAQRLAVAVSEAFPGLTVEVAQDKVWFTSKTEG